MSLPSTQPKRAVVVSSAFACVGAAGALALYLALGVMLGGLLALMWICALTVPAAVFVQRPARTVPDSS